MRRRAFDLDIEQLTHGQPASYWARPVNIDDGLEVIIWIRCLGGERLPTASYALRPNLDKLFFSPRRSSERRGIEIFCRVFSTHQPTTYLRSRYRIHPRLTRFVSCKASEYGWRPSKFHVHPWSRGREVCRDVLRSLPLPEKCLFFCHLLSIHQESNVFFSDAWQAPAMYHRPSCELCDPRVGRSPSVESS